MPDKYDPYREALVMETETAWPDDFDDWDASRRAALEQQLHQAPEDATHIEYFRTHTGFCRRIVVSPEDVQRLSAGAR